MATTSNTADGDVVAAQLASSSSSEEMSPLTRQLIAAIRDDDAAQLSTLLDSADPDALDELEIVVDGHDSSALHLAASSGAHAVAELLVSKYGFSLDDVVDAPGRPATTPLHEGVRHARVVARLLELGADADALDGAGRSPLWRAVEADAADSVTALLAAGACVRARVSLSTSVVDGESRAAVPPCAIIECAVRSASARIVDALLQAAPRDALLVAAAGAAATTTTTTTADSLRACDKTHQADSANADVAAAPTVLDVVAVARQAQRADDVVDVCRRFAEKQREKESAK